METRVRVVQIERRQSTVAVAKHTEFPQECWFIGGENSDVVDQNVFPHPSCVYYKRHHIDLDVETFGSY